VVTSCRRQPAALRSRATRCTSSRVHRERGFFAVGWSSAQTKPEATSAAVYCQAVPLVPLRGADVEAVELDLFARRGGVDSGALAA
jgi:hypothetical protein